MTNQFIEEQQELADEIVALVDEEGYLPADKAKEYIIQIITNTGEDLMRRAEGERKTQIRVHDYSSIHDQRTYVEIESRNKTIDTLKKHITNVTGVE